MEEVLKPDEAEAAIEALLFTMGEAISAETLGAVIGHDKATVVRLVHRLMDRYQNEKRGIRIIELDGAFQMCTSPEMYDYVIKLTHQPKKQVLTDVMLETLAIIAYKQPVTKAEIECTGAADPPGYNRGIFADLWCSVCRESPVDFAGRA